jgi:hypothetical protein
VSPGTTARHDGDMVASLCSGDMRLIQETLEHSDATVTERYARVIDREIVTMLGKLPDVAPQKESHERLSKILSIDASRRGVVGKTQ